MACFSQSRFSVTRAGLALSMLLFLSAGVNEMIERGAHFRLPWAFPAPEENVASEPVKLVDVEAPRKAAITEYLAGKYRQQPSVVRTFVDMAWAESTKHPDVSPELVLAVIQKESSLRPVVQSSYGAQGLMQVVPRFHPEKLRAKESLLDAGVNIRVGAAILQEYLSQSKGNVQRALRKYSGNARGYAEFVLREKSTLEDI